MLLGLAALAVVAVATAWLQRHPRLVIGVGRGVRGYLDGWAIDVEHGFGLIERAKIVLAFGLPVLVLGVVLSALWAAAAAVVAILGRWWRGWRCTGADPSDVAAVDRR